MKVILRSDVARVGRKHEVKEVSDGYAQNFLIRRGLAELATPAKIVHAQKHATQIAHDTKEAYEALRKGIHELSNGITVSAKANDQGHLFEGIHEAIIAEALSKVIKREVNESLVQLSAPLKEVGEHEVHVKVGEENMSLSVTVEPVS